MRRQAKPADRLQLAAAHYAAFSNQLQAQSNALMPAAFNNILVQPVQQAQPNAPNAPNEPRPAAVNNMLVQQPVQPNAAMPAAFNNLLVQPVQQAQSNAPNAPRPAAVNNMLVQQPVQPNAAMPAMASPPAQRNAVFQPFPVQGNAKDTLSVVSSADVKAQKNLEQAQNLSMLMQSLETQMESIAMEMDAQVATVGVYLRAQENDPDEPEITKLVQSEQAQLQRLKMRRLGLEAELAGRRAVHDKLKVSIEASSPSGASPLAPVNTGPPAPVSTGPPAPVSTGPPAPVSTGPPAPVITGPPALTQPPAFVNTTPLHGPVVPSTHHVPPSTATGAMMPPPVQIVSGAPVAATIASTSMHDAILQRSILLQKAADDAAARKKAADDAGSAQLQAKAAQAAANAAQAAANTAHAALGGDQTNAVALFDYTNRDSIVCLRANTRVQATESVGNGYTYCNNCVDGISAWVPTLYLQLDATVPLPAPVRAMPIVPALVPEPDNPDAAAAAPPPAPPLPGGMLLTDLHAAGAKAAAPSGRGSLLASIQNGARLKQMMPPTNMTPTDRADERNPDRLAAGADAAPPSARGSFLASIQMGAKLKLTKMTPTDRADEHNPDRIAAGAKAAAPSGRGGLFAAIQQGAKLRSSTAAGAPAPAPWSPGGMLPTDRLAAGAVTAPSPSRGGLLASIQPGANIRSLKSPTPTDLPDGRKPAHTSAGWSAMERVLGGSTKYYYGPLSPGHGGAVAAAALQPPLPDILFGVVAAEAASLPPPLEMFLDEDADAADAAAAPPDDTDDTDDTGAAAAAQPALPPPPLPDMTPTDRAEAATAAAPARDAAAADASPRGALFAAIQSNAKSLKPAGLIAKRPAKRPAVLTDIEGGAANLQPGKERAPEVAPRKKEPRAALLGDIKTAATTRKKGQKNEPAGKIKTIETVYDMPPEYMVRLNTSTASFSAVEVRVQALKRGLDVLKAAINVQNSIIQDNENTIRNAEAATNAAIKKLETKLVLEDRGTEEWTRLKRELAARDDELKDRTRFKPNRDAIQAATASLSKWETPLKQWTEADKAAQYDLSLMRASMGAVANRRNPDSDDEERDRAAENAEWVDSDDSADAADPGTSGRGAQLKKPLTRRTMYKALLCAIVGLKTKKVKLVKGLCDSYCTDGCNDTCIKQQQREASGVSRVKNIFIRTPDTCWFKNIFFKLALFYQNEVYKKNTTVLTNIKRVLRQKPSEDQLRHLLATKNGNTLKTINKLVEYLNRGSGTTTLKMA